MKNIFKLRSKAALLLGAAIISSSFTFSKVDAQEKVTGLSDFTIYLDPGHALKENQGLYNYSEAEKTLRVALSIREYLQTYTDIKAVYMCREDDNKQMTLTERTSEANALNADFYYSIHSDAGTPDQNSTLMMYGGWKTDGVVIEKTPNGGKAFGEALTPDLTEVMGLATRGNLADRTYYDSSDNHANKYPYLHVNRESNMASLLSEAGYHTNPYQQQRNLNAEYKRLEGLSAFRSILKFAGVDRPDFGVLTGVITDDETGIPANGVTITLVGKDKTYVTDSYESLFKNYSQDPNELHNGFYFFETFAAGENLTVEFSSPEFESQTKTVTITTNPNGSTIENLNTLNVQLKNIVPAKVTAVSAKTPSSVVKDKPLAFTFSRKMDKASTEAAISISPTAPYTFTWTDDYTLTFDLNGLEYETEYTLTIDGSKAKNIRTDNFLDGDADGIEGGDYVYVFKTAEQDNVAPEVVSYDPTEIDALSLRPIVRIEFSEELDEASIQAAQITVTSGGNAIEGIIKHTAVNKRSVLHYLFNSDLEYEKTYDVNMLGGLKDLYGNEIASGLQYSFTVKPTKAIAEEITIDDFSSIGTWWQPNGSGSTTGIDTDVSLRSSSTESYSIDSPSSMKLTYLWDEKNTSDLYRIRLYRNSKAPKFDNSYIMQAYVFGDGSGNNFRLTVRDTEGIKSKKPIALDWVGWKLVSWDMSDNSDCSVWLTGGSPAVVGNANFENIGLEPVAKPTEFRPSFILVDDIKIVKLKDYIPTGIENTHADNDLTITVKDATIEFTADSNITQINVYSLVGALVKSIPTNTTEYLLDKNLLDKGAYIIKVETETAQKVEKVILK